MVNDPTALENPSIGATSVYRVVREVLSELEESDAVEGLKKDLFRCFYQTTPPRVNIMPSCDWHEDISIISKMEILPQMRHLTMRNAVMAAFATLSSLESIRIWHQMDEYEPGALEEIRTDQGGRMLDDLRGLKEMEELVENIETSGNGGEDEGEGDNSEGESPGGGGSGEGTGNHNRSYDFSVRMRLLAMMRGSDTYTNIFKIFGRFQQVISDARKEDVFTGHGAASLDLGNEIARVPVNEIIKSTELLAKDLANDEALQISDDVDETPGEGPLAIMVDHSGSMYAGSEHIEGSSRQDVAIAIVLALQEVCQNQKRDMYITFFDSKVNYTFLCEDGVIQVQDLYKMIQISPNGGTSFRPPIIQTLNWLKDYKNADKTDIILLTDGCASEGVCQESIDDYRNLVSGNRKYQIDSNGQPITSSTQDWWVWMRSELDKYGSRFWILQIGDYMDNLVEEASDRCFKGLDNPENADIAYKSILREMVEAKKPKWLRGGS